MLWCPSYSFDVGERFTIMDEETDERVVEVVNTDVSPHGTPDGGRINARKKQRKYFLQPFI
jgi:hypothetical protein